MKRKTKAKIQQGIFVFIFMGFFSLIGGFTGYYLATMEEKELGIHMVILALVIITLVSFLIYYVNICLHEVGHVIFGRLTGYKFVSLRFGKLMLVKSENRLQIRKLSMAGTGGQALMLAPEGDEADYPVFFYNVGGLIVNFATSIICWAGYLLSENRSSAGAIILLIFAIMSMACFATNAIPFSEMGTDGANALILVKNRDARIIFRKTLLLSKLLADGVPLMDMPVELFMSDRKLRLDNPLASGQATNEFSYYLMNKQFDKARETGRYILDNATSIANIHELSIKSDLVFIAAAIDGDMETAKELFGEDRKKFRSMAGMIAIARMLYAYYSLCEVDRKKAENYRKTFETVAKSYPYKEDLRIERELVNMVDEKVKSGAEG